MERKRVALVFLIALFTLSAAKLYVKQVYDGDTLALNYCRRSGSPLFSPVKRWIGVMSGQRSALSPSFWRSLWSVEAMS